MKGYQFFGNLLLLLGLTASAARPPSPGALTDKLLHKKADATKAGYLAVYWKTSENGIFFALSTNDDPLSFTEINGGEPVIVPTLGTKVVRDVSIVPAGGADADAKWYLLGTDLNISAVCLLLGLFEVFCLSDTHIALADTDHKDHLGQVRDQRLPWHPDLGFH